MLVSLLDSARSPYPLNEVLGTADERFDGSGPHGLSGHDIPVGGRVLAAVDVYLTLPKKYVTAKQTVFRIGCPKNCDWLYPPYQEIR